MNYILSKSFQKSFLRMPEKIQFKVTSQLNIFRQHPLDRRLNNHCLSGVHNKYRSINITGDIRAIYKIIDNEHVVFTEIGSHSKLYK